MKIKIRKIMTILLAALILVGTIITNSAAVDFSSWTEKADMLEAVFGFGTVSLYNKIYTFGGYVNSAASSKVEVYDIESDTWVYKSNMSTARMSPAVAEVDGIIYVIGGRASSSTSSYKTIEAYDPETDTWNEDLSDLPIALQSSGITVVDSKIYVLGGYNNSSVVNTVYVYDPDTDVWSTEGNMPTAKGSFSTVNMGGKIYTFGGSTGSSSLNNVDVYDIETGEWTAMTAMSNKLAGARAFVLDGHIYLAGGINVATSVTYNTIKEYDPENDAWSDAGTLPAANYAFGITVIDNDMYIYGGMSSDTYKLGNAISAPTLSATADNNEVTLSWDSIDDAASYNVYRSTTSGGEYTQIATGVTDTTYTDNDVSNGTTYYYVVTAVDSDGNESAYSNEASATPENAGNALLRITMITGENKEYDLTADEANDFVSWYNDAESNSYTFNLNYNIGTLTSRTDRITHHKIAFFEVMAYSDDSTAAATTTETYTSLLKITMATGDVLEYEMTDVELNSFNDWYDNEAADNPAFSIDKTFNLGPFTSRTDYIVYDMISDYETMVY